MRMPRTLAVKTAWAPKLSVKYSWAPVADARQWVCAFEHIFDAQSARRSVA
jgi:hypothetical protein